MRLRLVPQKTEIDFFRYARATFGASVMAMLLSLVLWAVLGLNFGIDFRGGTTIRTISAESVDVGAYSAAIQPLGLGDVSITEVFDPTFGAGDNVAMIRVQAQEGQESVSPETVAAAARGAAGRGTRPGVPFGGVGGPESVGRADPRRRHRRGNVAPANHGLHLAALRVAVRGRRGRRALSRRAPDDRHLRRCCRSGSISRRSPRC